jgi:hypothetical protein
MLIRRLTGREVHPGFEIVVLAEEVFQSFTHHVRRVCIAGGETES